ncbi:uncharacterized protein FYW49_008990 [Xenentodon cancila]
MGQLFSSEEHVCQLKAVIGSILYDAMLHGDAVADLRLVHPLTLAGHEESAVSQSRLQEQLQQLQSEIGSRAPSYLRDLIGRLSSFSEEPRLAGLVGLVVTMVMDLAYTSSKQSSGVKGRSAGSSSCQQRVWELQEVMEEYLKRCRINLSDKKRLIQDFLRLEAQFSLILTQLKTCLLGGDCDSRSLRHWASGAIFHTQMLVHLAHLEDKAEPFSAKAALEQYKEDLSQIIPTYRHYKSNTVCVVKCRGSILGNSDPSSEEGTMTGLTVTDRDTGKSVTIPLSHVEAAIGRSRHVSGTDDAPAAVFPQVSLDLITSDQYTQAYLDHLFSEKGPIAELENCFVEAGEKLGMQRTKLGCKNKMGVRHVTEQREGVHLADKADGGNKEQGVDKMEMRGDETARSGQTDASLKLSVVETQPEESSTTSSSYLTASAPSPLHPAPYTHPAPTLLPPCSHPTPTLLPPLLPPYTHPAPTLLPHPCTLRPTPTLLPPCYLTHPAPILLPPCSHPTPTLLPPCYLTHPAPTLLPPYTHPATSPTLLPSCSHPAPTLHPPCSHPTPTLLPPCALHPPCFHPAPILHPAPYTHPAPILHPAPYTHPAPILLPHPCMPAPTSFFFLLLFSSAHHFLVPHRTPTQTGSSNTRLKMF